MRYISITQIEEVYKESLKLRQVNYDSWQNPAGKMFIYISIDKNSDKNIHIMVQGDAKILGEKIKKN